MKHYTPEKKAEAMAVLAANNGNVRKTAEATGISRRTLAQWAKDVELAAAPSVEQAKRDLAEHLEALVWKLADAIPDKIAKASLQHTATTLGIIFDKLRLVRGEATVIEKSEQNVTSDIAELEAAYNSVTSTLLVSDVLAAMEMTDGGSEGYTIEDIRRAEEAVLDQRSDAFFIEQERKRQERVQAETGRKTQMSPEAMLDAFKRAAERAERSEEAEDESPESAENYDER